MQSKHKKDNVLILYYLGVGEHLMASLLKKPRH